MKATSYMKNHKANEFYVKKGKRLLYGSRWI